MAPTPNVNTHLLQCRFTITALTHKLQFHVNAALEGGVWKLISHTDTHTAIGSVIAYLENVIGPCLPTGSTGAGWTLFERVEGALVPVDTGAFTFTPSVAAVFVAMAETYYWRDMQQIAMKASLISEKIPGCFKATSVAGISSYSGDAHDFAEELSTDDDTHFGGYWCSLAGNGPKSFISWVNDSNEKVRRARGVK